MRFAIPVSESRIFHSHSGSQNLGMEFFTRIPVPENWEWNFHFRSRSQNSGMVFAIPVPENWKWNFHSHSRSRSPKVIPAHPWPVVPSLNKGPSEFLRLLHLFYFVVSQVIWLIVAQLRPSV